MLFNIQGG